jgi:hypothetical protein
MIRSFDEVIQDKERRKDIVEFLKQNKEKLEILEN